MAVCLAHRRDVYVELQSGGYLWLHADGSVCEAVPAVTAAEAGEVCACGHERHRALPGPIPPGRSGKPRPCTECLCPDFAHQWQR